MQKCQLLRSILKQRGRVRPEGIWAAPISPPRMKISKNRFYNGNCCWSIIIYYNNILEFYHLTSRLSLSSKLRGREGGGGERGGWSTPGGGTLRVRGSSRNKKRVFCMIDRESLQLWLFNPLQVKIGHVVALSLNTGVSVCVSRS